MNALIHLTPAGYLVVLATVTVGALVQGSVGFGGNLLAAPVLAAIEPSALPAALLMPILLLALTMVARERHGVDWPSVGWLMVGRVPGTIAGSLVVVAVAAETLSVLAGATVLLAVAASVLAATIPVTRGTQLATGAVSGAMGTATSIGGPPLALLYQHQDGPVLRATLAATFACGTALSTLVLVAAGAVGWWHVWLAAALAPGTLTGVTASSRVVGRVDGPWLRPAVLGFASVAAVVAMVRGLG